MESEVYSVVADCWAPMLLSATKSLFLMACALYNSDPMIDWILLTPSALRAVLVSSVGLIVFGPILNFTVLVRGELRVIWFGMSTFQKQMSMYPFMANMHLFWVCLVAYFQSRSTPAQKSPLNIW